MKTMLSNVRTILAMLCALLYFLETQKVVRLLTLRPSRTSVVSSPKPVERSRNQQAHQHEDGEHGGGVHTCRSTPAKPPQWQGPTTALDRRERTSGAGLIRTEPAEAVFGRSSSREDEGAAQRPQAPELAGAVAGGQRVCGHQPVAVAVQHHVLGLEALALGTSVQQLGRASGVSASPSDWTVSEAAVCSG